MKGPTRMLSRAFPVALNGPQSRFAAVIIKNQAAQEKPAK